MGECLEKRFILLSDYSAICCLDIIDGPRNYNFTLLSHVIFKVNVAQVLLALRIVLTIAFDCEANYCVIKPICVVQS